MVLYDQADRKRARRQETQSSTSLRILSADGAPLVLQSQVQLTMVLYDQADYNRARRWRLPRCTLSPGEYQVSLV